MTTHPQAVEDASKAASFFRTLLADDVPLQAAIEMAGRYAQGLIAERIERDRVKEGHDAD